MTKKVAVFNDISGFGKCSLTAALPVLSVLGVQCNPIPTMVLTGQGGYEVSVRRDLTDMLPDYTYAWKENGASFDGIYSGYLTGPEQFTHVFQFLETFRKEDTFLLVDPVMGDDWNTYQIYSDELLNAMKKLSRQANLITPNLTGACLLSDTAFEEITHLKRQEDILEKVSQIAYKLRNGAEASQDVMITGVRVENKGKKYIYNVALTATGIHYFSSEGFEKSFSGTGDLLASSICGLRLNGYSTEEAMEIAGKFLYHSIEEAIEDATDVNDGVAFEKHLKELIVYAK